MLAGAIQHERAGQLDDAVLACEALLGTDPDNSEALCFLGKLRAQQGNFDGAAEAFAKSLALDPLAAETLLQFGRLHLRQSKPRDARSCFARILEIDAHHSGAHYGLGNVNMALGQLDAALACFAAAITAKPDYAEAHCNSGVVHESRGEPAKAIAAYRNALAINPQLANAHFNLTLLLMAEGDQEHALHHIGRYVALDPNAADAWNIKGRLHHALHDFQPAIEAYENALSIDPKLHETHNSLGVLNQMRGNYGAAIESFRAAIARRPDFVGALSNLGMALLFMGKSKEALTTLRDAVGVAPDAAYAYSNYLFCLSHDENASAQDVFVEHRAFGERFEAPLRAQWSSHSNQPDPGRKLRIGFVSADLYAHAVSTFIEPVWSGLGAGTSEIWVYANNQHEDEVTQRLKALTKNWRVVTSLSDEDLAQQIRQDEIDILFDLSGHTAGNRLLTFARRPAPVQVSWIGNPNTTGLTAMDYYLTDRFCSPPGLLDPLFTEKIVQLETSTAFQPHAEAPDVNELPALQSGKLTFGSFARSNKITERTIALWCRVLKALPDSRMMIGGLSDSARKQDITRQLGNQGLAPDRILFQPNMEMDRYLALHGQIDVVLDTHPFGGGTTSCHALWMGVPVLSLAGDTMSSRVGAALNGHVNLPDFTVGSADDFVAQAVHWSTHLPELARLRAELRPRMSASALCQPAIAARTLETAMRQMWHLWCNRLPPRSFSVGGDQ